MKRSARILTMSITVIALALGFIAPASADEPLTCTWVNGNRVCIPPEDDGGDP